MAVMRALIHDPAAPHGLRHDDVPDPVPGPNQALVQVAATSLNYGEVTYLGGRPVGSVPGWDASGVVVASAASGEGPAVGRGWSRSGGTARGRSGARST